MRTRRSRSSQRRWLRSVAVGWLGLASVLAAGLAGCSGPKASDPLASVRPDPAATAYAAERIEAWGEAVDPAWRSGGLDRRQPARTVRELLPNVQFRHHRTWSAESDSVVIAVPTEVHPGTAHALVRSRHGSHRRHLELVAFDDPTAVARSWLLRIEVLVVAAGRRPDQLVPTAKQHRLIVRITSAGGPIDPATFRTGLLGLGESAWFLVAPSEGRGAFTVAWHGGAIATVARGTLHFPFLPEARQRRAEAAHLTVHRLRGLGALPSQRRPGRT